MPLPTNTNGVQNTSVFDSQFVEAELLIGSVGSKGLLTTEIYSTSDAFKSHAGCFENTASLQPIAKGERNANEEREESFTSTDMFSASFQTGLGNKIFVPVSSIEEAEKLLNLDEGSCNLQTRRCSNDEELEWARAAPLGAITSVAALSQSRINKLDSHGNFSIQSAANTSGFHTAGAKTKLSISDASIKNAQKILLDPPHCIVFDSSSKTCGTRKTLAVLENAQQVFTDCSDNASHFVAFQTAGAGTAASINNTSLRFAQNILVGPADEDSTISRRRLPCSML